MPMSENTYFGILKNKYFTLDFSSTICRATPADSKLRKFKRFECIHVILGLLSLNTFLITPGSSTRHNDCYSINTAFWAGILLL